MRSLTGTVPVNNSLLTGTVPVNNSLLRGTVPVNNFLLAGTSKSGPEKYGECGNSVPRKVDTYQEVKANLTERPQKIFRKDQYSMSQIKG